jgi:ergothioneine biosynthesis protein EgtB
VRVTRGAKETPRLVEEYRAVRDATEWLCEPLQTEDYVAQSLPDASPVKWHLAHTTWFFETFILARTPNFRPFHAQYESLFNSYYQSLGPQLPRERRVALSRPTVSDVRRYRGHVDRAMGRLLDRDDLPAATRALVALGLAHEQQHQELIVTDVKHLFATNPLRPVYRPSPKPTLTASSATGTPAWIEGPEGPRDIGQNGSGFAFDHEMPRHTVFLRPFKLADRLVTCAEYRAFMEDGGYRRPTLWLSDGWDAVRREGWLAPLYWEDRDGDWWMMTLTGFMPVDPAAPVCHVSFYEADAFARWSGARLPTEAEWETVAARERIEGNFLEDRAFHPQPRTRGPQLYGDVWEWTNSAFAPYPGYRPARGALGEYNGKFMSGRMVLRGGSCATPRSHMRPAYRNYFPPTTRWQFSGLRLARDA